MTASRSTLGQWRWRAGPRASASGGSRSDCWPDQSWRHCFAQRSGRRGLSRRGDRRGCGGDGGASCVSAAQDTGDVLRDGLLELGECCEACREAPQGVNARHGAERERAGRWGASDDKPQGLPLQQRLRKRTEPGARGEQGRRATRDRETGEQRQKSQWTRNRNKAAQKSQT